VSVVLGPGCDVDAGVIDGVMVLTLSLAAQDGHKIVLAVVTYLGRSLL
jgi:hypothetical protein